MVMTIDRLEELCEDEGLEYFVPRCNFGFPAPCPRVMTVNVSGVYGSYQVVIHHEFGGGFRRGSGRRRLQRAG